jgi:hypothetical protein
VLRRMLVEDLGEKKKKQEDLIGAGEEVHWVGWSGLRPALQVSSFLRLYIVMWGYLLHFAHI